MAYPKLPYWFYTGRVSAPVAGPVYVLTGDGMGVVECAVSAVLTPRLKFFAPTRSVAHLVRNGIVKRLPQPNEPDPAKKPAEEASVADSKSEPTNTANGESGAQDGLSDPGVVRAGEGSVTPVVASGAGAGEAGGSSVPEEKETAASSKRRSRRS